MTTNTKDSEWWKSFHLLEMADTLLERTPEQLSETLKFLKRELHLESGQHVFDQCCGAGSLSIPLAKDGLQVTGCDLFEPFIKRAKLNSAGLQTGTAEFFCSDAFEFLPERPCDAVFNWYSSFGYALDDATNQQMFERAFAALKPGGRFALDILSVPSVMRNFSPIMVQAGRSEGRAVRIQRNSEIEFATGRLKQIWIWEIEGQEPITRHSAMKIYLPNRIVEMLIFAGFTCVRLLGSLSSAAYEMDSPRLLVLAEKPR